jgi:3-hydroxyisobutyrate dehydrogenase-like beta-hydroxyacid dehydrogenase
MQLGFIGLGNIGGALAANLVADGHDLAVYDREPERVRELVRRGARAAADVADVARRGEITFASLPTPKVVRAVVEQWLPAAQRGQIFVDLSTNSPEIVRELGERIASAGARLLEAPLTGGAPGAQNRMLVFMVGGDAADFERCRPLLEKLGRATFHMGPLGAGNTMKLINSLLSFTAAWVALEGLAITAKAGLDLRQVVEMLRTGGSQNMFIDRMVEGINQRGRPTQFALELAAKDAGLIVDLARSTGVPAPVAGAIAHTLVGAVGAGLGERDWSDWVELIERQAGVQLRLPPAAVAPGGPAAGGR